MANIEIREYTPVEIDINTATADEIIIEPTDTPVSYIEPAAADVQAVDANGVDYTTWSGLLGKPFNEIGSNLAVTNGRLDVVTENKAEKDNTKPITSGGVYKEIGNIEALLTII